jgi:hypothetical protein
MSGDIKGLSPSATVFAVNTISGGFPMTALNEVFVVSAVRTAVGTHGGSLKDTPLGELATFWRRKP